MYKDLTLVQKRSESETLFESRTELIWVNLLKWFWKSRTRDPLLGNISNRVSLGKGVVEGYMYMTLQCIVYDGVCSELTRDYVKVCFSDIVWFTWQGLENLWGPRDIILLLLLLWRCACVSDRWTCAGRFRHVTIFRHPNECHQTSKYTWE